MSVPSGPDVEWVRTLKVGDAVAICDRSSEVYRATVMRITSTGRIKVGFEGYAPRTWADFRPNGYAYERLRFGWRPRYLVKPEDKP